LALIFARVITVSLPPLLELVLTSGNNSEVWLKTPIGGDGGAAGPI
jgi:hypothetical protein